MIGWGRILFQGLFFSSPGGVLCLSKHAERNVCGRCGAALPKTDGLVFGTFSG